MNEEKLHREIISGAFSMRVADCERNIRIQFEKLQQENQSLKDKIEEAIEYIENRIVEDDYILRTDTKMVQKELLDLLEGDKNE